MVNDIILIDPSTLFYLSFLQCNTKRRIIKRKDRQLAKSMNERAKWWWKAKAKRKNMLKNTKNFNMFSTLLYNLIRFCVLFKSFIIAKGQWRKDCCCYSKNKPLQPAFHKLRRFQSHQARLLITQQLK